MNETRARKILEERERKKKERNYLKSLYEGTKSFFNILF